jgi:hypothetical protein
MAQHMRMYGKRQRRPHPDPGEHLAEARWGHGPTPFRATLQLVYTPCRRGVEKSGMVSRSPWHTTSLQGLGGPDRRHRSAVSGGRPEYPRRPHIVASGLVVTIARCPPRLVVALSVRVGTLVLGIRELLEELPLLQLGQRSLPAGTRPRRLCGLDRGE